MHKIAFFDFDETIVKINSFPLFIIFASSHLLKTRQYRSLFAIIRILVRRKIFKSVSHEALKFLMLSVKISDTKLDQIAHYLSKRTRASVVNALREHYYRGDTILISSAAPEHYLTRTLQKILPDLYPEVIIIGSKIIGGQFKSNYKRQKYHALLECIEASPEVAIVACYTDSYDDISIAEVSEQTILVTPSKNTLILYKNNANTREKLVVLNN